MIIVLNGPLGIGKSTLGEMLTESIKDCALLDGDRLVAVNPTHRDELEHLHSTIALLVAHHYRFGYRHFVIDHFWRSETELGDLRQRLAHLIACSFCCNCQLRRTWRVSSFELVRGRSTSWSLSGMPSSRNARC